MEKISGAQALIKALLNEGVDTIFGYPGGAIIPVFDAMYDFYNDFKYVLTRHEQGAIHSAQGYARVSGKPGVCIVTSGPGATNTITGIGDAMLDNTPLVVITGQVGKSLLGTDAFQEIDVVGITQPITKWSYQIRDEKEIAWAVARAFYIANNGRPGPVVLDFAKNAQTALVDFKPEKCNFIRSYIPTLPLKTEKVEKAAELINNAKKPLALVGHGVTIGKAEEELKAFLEVADIPAAWTMLGESAMATDYPLNKGMLGMHGNIGPNIKTNECDLLIAIGMRFDDRITGDLNTYAKQAKKIHFDIDPSEFNKNVAVDLTVLGNSKESIAAVTEYVNKTEHKEWLKMFDRPRAEEQAKVIDIEVSPKEGTLKMGEVVSRVSKYTNNSAVVVTDVGQNQMMGVRYSGYSQPRSVITSGGLGTMGFGLGAAMGAMVATKDPTILITGDGSFGMNLNEMATAVANKVPLVILLMNNGVLGMVRQWQTLFFQKHYSNTMLDARQTDFVKLAEAFGAQASRALTLEELDEALEKAFSCEGPYLIDCAIDKDEFVLPMLPPGGSMDDIIVKVGD